MIIDFSSGVIAAALMLCKGVMLLKSKRAKVFINWDSVPVTFGSDICAMILGMHQKTVQAMAKAGKIPAHKPGKNYVHLKDEIIEWLKKLTVKL